MKRKLLSYCVCFSLATGSALAQSAQIKAGLNLANISVSDDGSVDDAKQLASFHVGIIADVPLGTGLLSFQPGLLFTGKGSETMSGSTASSNYSKQTFNPKYIEIPANFVFKLPLGKEYKFFAGAGPYLGIGVGGKNKVMGRIAGLEYSSEKEIRFSNDDPTTISEEEGTGFGIMRRFDYGFNGTGGVEGKTAVLSVNYGYGLAKLRSGTHSSANDNNKHRVLGISLGFKF
jgi:hypothetical protein